MSQAPDQKQTIAAKIHAMRSCAPAMAATSLELRNAALAAIAKALRAGAQEIFEANAKDLAAAAQNRVPAAVQGRLAYNEHKLADSLAQLEGLIQLEDPVGHCDLERELACGLTLKRVSCPIGVIGVIFEARPDALVQISSLCIKSGNCAVLKGGRETRETNTVLFRLIHEAATSAGIPQEALLSVESHADIDALLVCDTDVDLLIPRGSNQFVRYIMDHTRIPVMGHSSGVCHMYVDRSANLDMAARLAFDSKTQYPVACNALETLLVDRAIAPEFLPKLAATMAAKQVVLHATPEACELLGAGAFEGQVAEKNDDNWSVEYGDLELSVKLVGGVDEAIAHINRYGSHHTDCVVSEDAAVSAAFCQLVDSAGVYHNASTRFADGYRYGFGAEVGISTGKLHARGPVGLDGMVTYKYVLEGSGDIVADFASGERSFTHRDLL